MNEYQAYVETQRAHQQIHNPSHTDPRPELPCTRCLIEATAGSDPLHAPKRHYAWAIPNDEALTAINSHAPHGLVELGAGNGYWASLLRERDVDVLAYDPAPPGTPSDSHDGHAWSEVLTGNHTAIDHHGDRTLLLVWPSYDKPWAAEAVQRYTGNTVCYVGEPAGGCTGDARLHELLGDQSRFTVIDTVPIPQWFGFNDTLHIYQRNES
ncbi:hypothetical protein [Sciscionella sediminilitoris]|uniref:hypothetical protein n=1 Tax=Sciscionella sediminilitoris TaxID=1445613 RepID=UPI0006893DFB|nr:hypothetical protein [Sciscionella sp. SE31]